MYKLNMHGWKHNKINKLYLENELDDKFNGFIFYL